MKILVVHPGASMSTADVARGLTAGLRARNHSLWEYALDARIERQTRALATITGRARDSDLQWWAVTTLKNAVARPGATRTAPRGLP